MLIIILPLALIIDVDDNGQPRRGRRSLVIVVGRFRKKTTRSFALSPFVLCANSILIGVDS